ncbi:hypothetical protein CH373_01055 [Leptospira perolatii]|uniref:Uncharacterized protein n=1 Tax=Leptospira perolatii TaxID=2023191 RepID=A0A2M9ZRH1_9LEPT|nr:hypothetical protein CH360_01055 [Leptospira perolatii]PJZ74670.1 hypothetical protein CH373_01055 [Leptospira perolatii]
MISLNNLGRSIRKSDFIPLCGDRFPGYGGFGKSAGSAKPAVALKKHWSFSAGKEFSKDEKS